MSAPAVRVKTPESLEMKRIEDKTGGDVVVNLFARSSGILLTLDSRCGTGYADLP